MSKSPYINKWELEKTEEDKFTGLGTVEMRYSPFKLVMYYNIWRDKSGWAIRQEYWAFELYIYTQGGLHHVTTRTSKYLDEFEKVLEWLGAPPVPNFAQDRR